MSVSANSQVLGTALIQADAKFNSVKLLLNNSTWRGVINSLELSFKGKSGSAIEIDSIKVAR